MCAGLTHEGHEVIQVFGMKDSASGRRHPWTGEQVADCFRGKVKVSVSHEAGADNDFN